MTAPYFSFTDPNQDATDPLAAYQAPPVSAAPAGPLGALTSLGQMAAPRPNFFARLFGGADPLQGGLLTTPEASGMGRQALRDFGINLLQNSGPAPYKRGLGELLGTALNAGQQAYTQGTEHALSNQGLVAQRQNAQRVAALRAQYAGRTDPQSLLAYMNGLIGIGTPEAVRSASAISEYLKSQREARPNVDYRGGVVDPATGKSATAILNPADPTHPLGYLPEAPTAVRPESPTSLRGAGMQFQNTLYDPFVVKSINTYHQFESHFAQAQKGNPAAYKSTVSAFIANAEPNNQLRLGMLQYLQEVDPSVRGRADIALQKLQDGTWPDSVLQGMQQVVEDNYRQVRERTQAIYDDFVANNPGVYVTPPSIRFGDAQGRGAPAHGTTGGSGFQFRRRP